MKAARLSAAGRPYDKLSPSTSRRLLEFTDNLSCRGKRKL